MNLLKIAQIGLPIAGLILSVVSNAVDDKKMQVAIDASVDAKLKEKEALASVEKNEIEKES